MTDGERVAGYARRMAAVQFGCAAALAGTLAWSWWCGEAVSPWLPAFALAGASNVLLGLGHLNILRAERRKGNGGGDA